MNRIMFVLANEWKTILIEDHTPRDKYGLGFKIKNNESFGVFGLKPKNIEVTTLGSSFIMLATRVLEKHKHPNTLKDLIS